MSARQEFGLKCGDILLISGYRRHGKDTLFEHLSGKQNRFEYNPLTADGKPILFPSERYVRLAFADVLKMECSLMLGLSLQEIEEKKDDPLPEGIFYEFRATVPASTPPSVRDVLIDHGAYCRAIDINYFCRCVAKQAKDNLDCITVVTDFRYVNEHAYLTRAFRRSGRRVVTLRVYRSEVPIPDETKTSEHQLDDFNFQIKITS